MKNLFQSTIKFIKSNPSVLYSMVLLIIIPLTIYLNTFFILNKVQSNIDKITLSYSVMAQNIINLAAENSLDNPEKLQELVGSIMSQNEEVKQIEFLSKDPGSDNFKVVASSEDANIGKETNTQDVWNTLAWNQKENIAFLSSDAGKKERVWKLTQIFKDNQGQKIGLISLAISLDYSDKLINSTIDWSYLVLIITVFIVLLLVINNARFLGYAIMVSKLKEIDKMKDNFISMASHELRSPLTAIRGYLEFFNDKNKGKMDEESTKYLNNINTSVERLNALVNDILEISRLEGNRIPFNIAALDPAPLIQKSIDELKSQAMEKKLSLLYAPSTLPKIKADADRIEQIVINLISNAIKYTPQGKVEILTETKDKELLITVADTGMGISAEDAKNLFEKFYRVKNDQTERIVGTGLGLWIAREMARKMDGDITVESIKGVGSHFTLHLPLA